MLLQLNVRYKTRVALKLTGITGPAAPSWQLPGWTDAAVLHRAKGEVVPFEPGPVVTMYTCGITPYDATHLGHAAVYVTYDVLQRRLIDLGHEVRCVRNITDVDDSILGKARELGVHYLDLAAGETARFDDDMRALGMLPSCSRAPGHRRPSPTSAGSSAWCSTGATPTRPAAPSTSTCRPSRLRFGGQPATTRARCSRTPAERGGNVDDPNKRNPLDFVLWQPSRDRRAVVGHRCGARAGRAGTSSARRWRCASWAPPSTSTAAAPT